MRIVKYIKLLSFLNPNRLLNPSNENILCKTYKVALPLFELANNLLIEQWECD